MQSAAYDYPEFHFLLNPEQYFGILNFSVIICSLNLEIYRSGKFKKRFKAILAFLKRSFRFLFFSLIPTEHI